MRRRAFGASFLHLAALVLAFQVHASFLLLALASALLWHRGYFKLHWPAALAGGAVAALPLVPWALEVSSHPVLVTAAQLGFPRRGLLYLFPSLRGIAYWLRYPSLGLPEKVASISARSPAATTIGWGRRSPGWPARPCSPPPSCPGRPHRPARRRAAGFAAW